MSTTQEEKNQKYKEERRKCWVTAWTMTANANDCKSTQTATNYADKALLEFDLRFRCDFL